ncbi:MAG: DUF1993 domain-containing protein [Gammaproteobacteria bacterium]|nr:DUF1993 domain-containing protein [Gammaproteobacteria bacterium]
MIHKMVVQFSKLLGNLVPILDKAAAHAEAKKFEVEVLLQARLAPDQFNFIRQIQIACDTAKVAAARLADKEQEVPPHADTEQTVAELKSRINNVMAYLGTFSEADFADAAQRRITTPRWKGKWLSGEEFLLQHAIPNLNFHVITAYAILRHNGVEIGKKDFLGEMPYKE